MVTLAATDNSIGRQQLYLALRKRIEDGQYPHGAWLPAERAIAQEFGVDRSAVRSALTQLEEQGMILRESGRRPWVSHERRASLRPAGASTIAAKFGTIVAIVPQHPIYPASLALLHGINSALRSQPHSCHLQILDTHGDLHVSAATLEKQALETVIHEKIAGVILWHMGGDETVPYLRELEGRGIPLVLVDRYPQDLDCDFVGVDNQAGIEEAVAYLRALGHRRIAHLTTDEKTTAVLQRRSAFCEAMGGHGIRWADQWIFEMPYVAPEAMGPAVDHFFSLPEPPTALLAMNDSLAHYVITEAEGSGRRIPEDISVMGFDDLERYSPRPALLTTMHQPFDKIGRRAADLLLRRLKSPEAAATKQHILLSTPLVERSTCRQIETASGD